MIFPYKLLSCARNMDFLGMKNTVLDNDLNSEPYRWKMKMLNQYSRYDKKRGST